MLLSVPPTVCNWLCPHDVKGWMISDWGYLIYLMRRAGFAVTADIRDFFTETLFWNSVPAFLFGLIAQYFIMLGWEKWRTNRLTVDLDSKPKPS